MTDVQIRLSIPEDIPALVALDHMIWNTDNAPGPLYWNSAQAYAQMHPPGTQIVAAFHGKVCGYVGFRYPTPLLSNQHVIEVSLGVDPSVRRQGIGKKLLQSAAVWARQHGKTKMSLRVLATNHTAIKFYQACGFKIQGRLIDEFFINGKYVDDILMFKRIDEFGK
ncbi:GNAT family N-acetyltransferase [Marinicrinis lubricantis]|uniref:GNAT family N-acetyltransferase n=1 Tax=Marinicrinis lubricantis TaxID=2086470 RepID=A0ABW1IL47_9BACL